MAQLEQQLQRTEGDDPGAEDRALLHRLRRPRPQQTVAAAPAAPATPAFSSAPGVSVALHGFVNASAFTQNRSFTFGNGQNAEFPVPGSERHRSAASMFATRASGSISAGAKFTDNWNGGGRIEMDFFGGFNGTGAYSQQQPTPRLRQAYMDLTNADTGTTVRIGQQWDLMFPLDNVAAPRCRTSPSRSAMAPAWSAGAFPGVVVMQDLNHGSDRCRSGGSTWACSKAAGTARATIVNYLTAGNAGFRPQLEARLHVQDKTWLAYVAAHYSEDRPARRGRHWPRRRSRTR